MPEEEDNVKDELEVLDNIAQKEVAKEAYEYKDKEPQTGISVNANSKHIKKQANSNPKKFKHFPENIKAIQNRTRSKKEGPKL